MITILIVLVVIVIAVATYIIVSLLFTPKIAPTIDTDADSDDDNDDDEINGEIITEEEDTIPKVSTSLTEKFEVRSIKNLFDVVDDQKIPKNIVQTNYSNLVLSGMNSAIKTIQRLNPEYNYYYFDNDQSSKFIKDNFSSDIFEAYQTLVPGAYKADLFRVCFLLINGGVYLDTGFVGILPLRELLTSDDEFVCPEDNKWSESGIPHIHNAFLASIPNHPILREALKAMINNINNKFYGESTLEITGPIAIGKVFSKYLNVKIVTGNTQYGEGIRTIQFLRDDNKNKRITNGENQINGQEKVFFYTKYNTYIEEAILNSTIHYNELWSTRNVYGEKGKNDIYAEEVKRSVSFSKKIVGLYTSRKIKRKRTLVKVEKHFSGIDKEKTIIQISDDYVPIRMYNAMKSVRNMNLEYSIIRFNLEEVQAYLKDQESDFYTLSDEECVSLFVEKYLEKNEKTIFINCLAVCITPLRELKCDFSSLKKIGNIFTDSVSEAGFENRVIMYEKYAGWQYDVKRRISSRNTDLISSRGYSHFLSPNSNYCELPTESVVTEQYLTSLLMSEEYPLQKDKIKIFWIRNTSKQKWEGDLITFVESILPKISSPFVLVTTDGDRPTPESYPIEIVKKLIENTLLVKWYTQNFSIPEELYSLFSENDGGNSLSKIFPIPIGINLHDYPKEISIDIKSYFLKLRSKYLKNNKSDKILVDILNKSHLTRVKVEKLINDFSLKNERFDILSTRKSITDIHEEYSNHKYILSVRGNGLDCHRTWEILLCGGIVIVQLDIGLLPLFEKFKGIHVIKDWSEILEKDFLVKLDEKYKDYSPPSFREFQLNSFLNLS